MARYGYAFQRRILAGLRNSIAGRSSVMSPSGSITTVSGIPNDWKLPRAAMAKIKKVDGRRQGCFSLVSVRSPGYCLTGDHNFVVERTSVMHRSARITTYSCILDDWKLLRVAMRTIQKYDDFPLYNGLQVDCYRHGRSWSIRVTNPGSGRTDSEEPSDTNNKNTEVPDTPRKTGSAESSTFSADRPFRCQAAITACPRPPRPGLQPCCFFAESVHGDLVDCSGRGCQPLYANVLAQYFQLIYITASLKVVDRNTVKNGFDVSLECSPNDVQLVLMYASFTWRFLGNIPAADYLYRKAIKLSPHDPCVVEAYVFLICSGLYCTLSCRSILDCGLLVFLSRSARKAWFDQRNHPNSSAYDPVLISQQLKD